MASIRGDLHRNQLDQFAAWLETHGFQREPTKGDYEVLRVRRLGHAPMVYYARHGSDHATVPLDGPSTLWYQRWRAALRRERREGTPRRGGGQPRSA